LSIDVGNSFNCKHPNKFNDWRVVNLSIDVGNSFNFEHPDKFKDQRACLISYGLCYIAMMWYVKLNKMIKTRIKKKL
jgi:hypothetical protein